MTTVPVTGVHLGGANLAWHADLERTCQKRKAARAHGRPGHPDEVLGRCGPPRSAVAAAAAFS